MWSQIRCSSGHPQGDTPSSSPLLVLPPPHPAGGIVEVTVRVGTAKAIAAVHIAPTPLQSGTVAISPSSGTALDTVFTLRVVGATDSESLLYSFYLNDTLLSPIASASPVLRTVLPAGIHAVSARVRSVARSSFGTATAATVEVSAGVSPQVLARPFGPLDNASRAASPEDQVRDVTEEELR
jgi:REJ domain.